MWISCGHDACHSGAMLGDVYLLTSAREMLHDIEATGKAAALLEAQNCH